eukprot:144212_1
MQINNANVEMKNRKLAAYLASAIASIVFGAWAVFGTYQTSVHSLSLEVHFTFIACNYLGCIMGILGILGVYFQVKKQLLIMAQTIATSLTSAGLGQLIASYIMNGIPENGRLYVALMIGSTVVGIVCSVFMVWYWANMLDIELEEIKCEVATDSKGGHRTESEV